MCEPSNHCYECEYRFACLQLDAAGFEVPEARIRRQELRSNKPRYRAEREIEKNLGKGKDDGLVCLN